jgi:hypothetical protein
MEKDLLATKNDKRKEERRETESGPVVSKKNIHRSTKTSIQIKQNHSERTKHMHIYRHHTRKKIPGYNGKKERKGKNTRSNKRTNQFEQYILRNL